MSDITIAVLECGCEITEADIVEAFGGGKHVQVNVTTYKGAYEGAVNDLMEARKDRDALGVELDSVNARWREGEHQLRLDTSKQTKEIAELRDSEAGWRVHIDKVDDANSALHEKIAQLDCTLDNVIASRDEWKDLAGKRDSRIAHLENLWESEKESSERMSNTIMHLKVMVRFQGRESGEEIAQLKRDYEAMNENRNHYRKLAESRASRNEPDLSYAGMRGETMADLEAAKSYWHKSYGDATSKLAKLQNDYGNLMWRYDNALKIITDARIDTKALADTLGTEVGNRYDNALKIITDARIDTKALADTLGTEVGNG